MSNFVNQLADQLDFHWASQLRPRLDGLTLGDPDRLA